MQMKLRLSVKNMTIPRVKDMNKAAKSVLCAGLIGMTLGFLPNFTNMPSAIAQKTKICRVSGLSSAYKKLGAIPIIEAATNGASYSATAYKAGNNSFAYMVLDRSQTIVARVDLTYSVDRRGRNIANIKVCGNVQSASEFPGLQFSFTGGKRVNVSALGTQSFTHVVPRRLHSTAILTVIDAT